MSEYIFILKPKLKKGEKIVSLILSNNKGEILIADWSSTCGDKELSKRIKELKKLDEKIDKKMGINNK